MERIDIYPTHEYCGYKLRPGRPYPFGATIVPGGINFSVFSRSANYCVLVLYNKGEREPLVEIPFRGMFTKADSGEPVWGEFRIGNVYTMTVFDLDFENIEYGYRFDGPDGHVRKAASRVSTGSTRTWCCSIPMQRQLAGGMFGGKNQTGRSPSSTAAGWCMTTLTGKATARWRSRWKTW